LKEVFYHFINYGGDRRTGRPKKKAIPMREDIAASKQSQYKPKLAKDIEDEGKCTGKVINGLLTCPTTCPVHPMKSADIDRRNEREYTKTLYGWAKGQP
jgi:hypothetical protein